MTQGSSRRGHCRFCELSFHAHAEHRRHFSDHVGTFRPSGPGEQDTCWNISLTKSNHGPVAFTLLVARIGVGVGSTAVDATQGTTTLDTFGDVVLASFVVFVFGIQCATSQGRRGRGRLPIAARRRFHSRATD